MNASSNPINATAEYYVRNKARALCRRIGFTWDDRDDVEQELRIHLLIHLPHFDPAKASYKTFVNRLIETRAKELIRQRRAQRRNPCRVTCSLNEDVNDGEGGKAQLVSMMAAEDRQRRFAVTIREHVDSIDLAIDTETIVASLPEPERTLCRRLKTETLPGACGRMGLSPKQKYRCLVRIQQRFAEADLHEFLPGNCIYSQ